MEEVKGLKDYIKTKKYRQALDLPDEVEEIYESLAQGEYNKNYVFNHPKLNKKLVLRINFGSQMHLERQIEYEFNALKLLEDSKRTPKPIYVDGSLEELDHGIMVMEFLEGEHLDYKKDLKKASSCLADIHSIVLPKENTLLTPKNPVDAVLYECEEMFSVYENNESADKSKKDKIRKMLKRVNELSKSESTLNCHSCCINTELNSSNFLVNKEKAFLVDWEKPIIGEAAQDLAHFLAPTTSFWKTDIILSRKEQDDFISDYIQFVGDRFDTSHIRERTGYYIPLNCMRGITWCAMAWIQYKNACKGLRNEFTAKKLEAYLSDEFLELVEKRI